MSQPFIQNYTYDELNRLKTATETNNGSQTWTQVFGFDRYGNRNITSGTGVTNLTFNASNNRMTTSGYAYDTAGNTINDPSGKTFTYDAENKQTAVNNGSTGQYWYDGDGKRVKKYVPGTGETTVFVYDAAGKLVAEYSTAVEPQSTAKVAYMTSDHLGSPRINTDANGLVTSRHDYHPFGEEILTAQRTTGLNYAADTVRKQFTGYERDIESSLDFAQARYHAPSLGRFASPDPLLASASLELPQTWNRYSYVVNNPLALVDPDGLYPSPAYKCSETVKECLNDEQRRILENSKVQFGKDVLSGEALYKELGEKRQNAFINITDKLASYKSKDGTSLLASVNSVTEFRESRIITTVDAKLGESLKQSDEFSSASATQHAPYDAESYKSNDTTFGNVQLLFNETRDGADLDIDIGNAKSGDIAGPVVHGVEVLINKIFNRETNQDRVRRILINNPKIQTLTPSTDPKFNRRPK